MLDRAYMEKLGLAPLFDALNTYNATAADSIFRTYGAKGNVLELIDNMRFYTGKLHDLGRNTPPVWSEDYSTINCEKFTTNIANKSAALQ